MPVARKAQRSFRTLLRSICIGQGNPVVRKTILKCLSRAEIWLLTQAGGVVHSPTLDLEQQAQVK